MRAGCKAPESLMTYSSPLAKKMKSNISQTIAAKELAMRSGRKGKTLDFSMLDVDSPYQAPAMTERSYWGGAVDAFIDYTFSGPLELMAGKSVAQGAGLTALGTYSSVRKGVAIELGVDFAIMGIVLTAFDPANKWEGGADEWGVLGGNQQESLPGTMSAEEGTSFLWGFKQGPLGRLILG